MLKDLIKFTAKVGILAVIVVFVVVPNIPAMPNLKDYMPKLPSGSKVISFITDPIGIHPKIDEAAKKAGIPAVFVPPHDPTKIPNTPVAQVLKKLFH